MSGCSRLVASAVDEDDDRYTILDLYKDHGFKIKESGSSDGEEEGGIKRRRQSDGCTLDDE